MRSLGHLSYPFELIESYTIVAKTHKMKLLIKQYSIEIHKYTQTDK